MNGDDSLAIGVDLGATKIASALVDRDGNVIASRQTQTRADDGPVSVCDRIANEIRALITEGRSRKVAGVGIGSPGMVDREHGIVRGAVNLGWDEVPIVAEVSRRLGGMATFVDKDADVNAIGEGMFGSARDSRHYVLLTIGSGLGAGIVTDGHLVIGGKVVAADLGHYSLDPDNGFHCACGRRGCAETVVSGHGLATATRWVISRQTHVTELRNEPELTSAMVLDAAGRGDAAALAGLSMLARWLGRIAAVAAAVTSPDTIIIGGGLGVAAFDLVAAEAEREMYRHVSSILENTIRLRVATLASPAIGAASVVWSRLR